MKLARKLALAFILGTIVVLAVDGWLRIRREGELFDSTVRGEEAELAHVLAAALADVDWSKGDLRARSLVDAANTVGPLQSRWLWLPSGPEGEAPRVSTAELGPVLHGQPTTVAAVYPSGDERLYTYFPVVRQADRVGVLEIREPFAVKNAQARASLVHSVAAAGSVAVLCGALAMVLGIWLVGRPVQTLIDKARRVGSGKLEERVVLRSGDELAELASEMNTMGERLAGAREEIARETASRIAALEQLRHADRLATVGRLASGVAHELGTPLNVASGRAKMIIEGEVSGEEIAASARVVVDQVDRMTKIVRQLLDFARREGAPKGPDDLAAIARQTAAMLESLAGKSRVTIAVRGDAGSAPVSVHRGQIQQALANLVVNGIQAMPDGGRLEIGIDRERVAPPADVGGMPAEFVRLSVKDQGAGIAAEDVERVFEPFFTTKGIGEGTGLGLSVAYGIVRDHGGWIAVDGAPGRGSCFSIYLPRMEGECLAAS